MDPGVIPDSAPRAGSNHHIVCEDVTSESRKYARREHQQCSSLPGSKTELVFVYNIQARAMHLRKGRQICRYTFLS